MTSGYKGHFESGPAVPILLRAAAICSWQINTVQDGQIGACSVSPGEQRGSGGLGGHQHRRPYPIKSDLQHGYTKPDSFECLK